MLSEIGIRQEGEKCTGMRVRWIIYVNVEVSSDQEFTYTPVLAAALRGVINQRRELENEYSVPYVYNISGRRRT